MSEQHHPIECQYCDEVFRVRAERADDAYYCPFCSDGPVKRLQPTDR